MKLPLPKNWIDVQNELVIRLSKYPIVDSYWQCSHDVNAPDSGWRDPDDWRLVIVISSEIGLDNLKGVYADVERALHETKRNYVFDPVEMELSDIKIEISIIGGEGEAMNNGTTTDNP